MPVVVGNRVYLGIGRDYNYSGGNVPEGREYVDERGRPRKFGLGRFMCLEFDDVRQPPKLVWEDRHVAHVQANASVHNGLVYVSDLGGFLNCWDAETGEVVYKADVGASVRERSQMVTDGKVYVANDVHELRVLKAGREPDLLATNEIKRHMATPCPADGVLVLATPRQVFAYGKPNSTKEETTR
jgi:hypothetical protein